MFVLDGGYSFIQLHRLEVQILITHTVLTVQTLVQYSRTRYSYSTQIQTTSVTVDTCDVRRRSSVRHVRQDFNLVCTRHTCRTNSQPVSHVQYVLSASYPGDSTVVNVIITEGDEHSSHTAPGYDSVNNSLT